MMSRVSARQAKFSLQNLIAIKFYIENFPKDNVSSETVAISSKPRNLLSY